MRAGEQSARSGPHLEDQPRCDVQCLFKKWLKGGLVAPGGLGLAVLGSMVPGAPAQTGPANTPALPILEVSTVFERLEADEPSRGNPGSWSREHVLSPLE